MKILKSFLVLGLLFCLPLLLPAEEAKETAMVTLQGVVTEDEWDDEDNVTSVAISTYDDYYIVKNVGKGRELLSHLNEEVEVKGTVASLRPWVRYELADPTLESMSAGRKILLRVGPENQRRLQAKRVEEREGRPVRVPTPPVVGSPPAVATADSGEADAPSTTETLDEERT